jgi:hypothetical protein
MLRDLSVIGIVLFSYDKIVLDGRYVSAFSNTIRSIGGVVRYLMPSEMGAPSRGTGIQ